MIFQEQNVRVKQVLMDTYSDNVGRQHKDLRLIFCGMECVSGSEDVLYHEVM